MVGQNNPGFYNPRSGVGYMDAYKGSSIPYLSSSIAVGTGQTPADVVEIRFPHVTKSIAIKNTVNAASASAKIRVGFSANGVLGQGYPENTGSAFAPGPNNNYVVLDNEESYSADHRVTKVFVVSHEAVASTFQVAAGLTSIPFNELAGSWSGSAGVG